MLTISDKFIFRTHSLPLPSGTSLSPDSIRKLAESQEFMKAVWFSSPSLFHQLRKWLKGQKSSKKDDKVLHAVAKYILRASSRPTPFGMFAGCGVGSFGTATSSLDAVSLSYHVSLDTEVATALVSAVSGHEAVRYAIRYKVNSTLYRSGNCFRYAEHSNNRRDFTLTETEADDNLAAVLEAADDYQDLQHYTNALISRGYSPEESIGYIDELIASQILVGELDISTADDNVLQLLDRVLRRIGNAGCNDLVSRLKKVNDTIGALIGCADTGEIDALEARLKDELEKLGATGPFKSMLQCDTFIEPLPAPFQLKDAHRQQVTEALQFLALFCNSSENRNVQSFATAFRQRFEKQWIPLTTLMDSVDGFSYPVERDPMLTPFLNLVDFESRAVSQKTELGDVDRSMHQILMKAIRESADIIRLEEYFDQPSEMPQPLDVQPTTSAVAEIVRVDGQDRVSLLAGTGNSALDLISRFGHISGEIRAIAKGLASFEEDCYRDAIVADIIHLPESRLGNILRKPANFRCQIEYAARASCSKSDLISIRDILVTVTDDNHVYLWSRKHNSYLIPRLSSAHNFSFNTLPIYNLLCDVQNQSRYKYLGFTWGRLDALFDFFPRVMYKDVIVHPAVWSLRAAVFSPLLKAGREEGGDVCAAAKDVLEKYRIPSRVLLVAGDHELPIDFSSTMSVKIFLGEIKRSNLVKLKESLSNEVRNIQIVMHATAKKNHTFNAKPPAETMPQRLLDTVDNFLYYKIYGTEKKIDNILGAELPSVLAGWEGSSDSPGFFFTRYKDQHHHLRLRFACADREDRDKTMDLVSTYLKGLLEKNEIAGYEMQPYVREVERYGKDIGVVEQLFIADSMQTVSFLQFSTQSGLDELHRILFCLQSIDGYLNLFDLTPERKMQFCESVRQGFKSEFGSGLVTDRSLSLLYRRYKPLVLGLFRGGFAAGETGHEVDYGAVSRAVRLRSQQQLSALNEASDPAGLLPVLADIVHMSVNRLFISAQRRYEYVVYDLLTKAYASLKAFPEHAEAVN